MSNLWIDTDLGFDDMLAVMMIRSAGLEITGMSLVFGNTFLDQVQKNAAAMASFLNWRFLISSGAARPILGPTTTAQSVLGVTGIPTLGQSLADAPPTTPFTPALAAMVAWLEAAGDDAELLALGPLTNVAILALARPDLLPRLACLTWMGGSTGRGNHTPAAEFNAFADPEAAAIVLASGVPVRMVDLELCRQVTVSPEDLCGLRALGGARASLLADLFGGYINIGISRGRASMALYDPVAAAVVIDARSATFEPAEIRIELCDAQTRGQTIAERGRNGARVGSQADPPLVQALTLDAVLEAAKQ